MIGQICTVPATSRSYGNYVDPNANAADHEETSGAKSSHMPYTNVYAKGRAWSDCPNREG